METINTFLQDFAQIISDLLSNIFFHGLMGGLLGLIVGITIIQKSRKRGLFNRSSVVWSFLAKCNYVILPLAFMLMGLTQGGIYGAHDSAEAWIENTTTPIIDYAEGYIPSLQTFTNKYLLKNTQSNVSLEEMVEAQNPKGTSGIKGGIMKSFNVFLIGTFLDIASPTPGEIAEPLVLLSSIDLNRLDRKVFEILPASMRAATSYYFAGFYWMFFAPFGIYILVVVGEIILFKTIQRNSYSSEEKKYSGEYAFV